MYLHSKIALYQNKCEILYCCLPDLHSDQVIITIKKITGWLLIMFLPPFLIISLLTQLPYPYGNIKTLLWSENICKCGGRYTCVYVSEWGKRLVSSTVTQSFISPVRYFTALLLTHFSTHFTTTLFAAYLSLSVSISEFNEQTDVLKGSFTKDATYELLAVCLQPLSYCVLEVENLWSSSWRISISVLFFWSIFLPQRHGTLMYLKSHYYGITQLQRVISSALRCVRRGDKVWNPRLACAEWIERRRQEEGEIQRSEGFRLSALLWRILCPGCWVYHV